MVMMPRVNAAALLLLLSGLAGCVAAADDEIYAARDMGFFAWFSSKENQHGFAGRLDCEYGHPVKGKMCPPVMKEPMAIAKPVKDKSALETFSRCLDDPDLPECRELQVGQVTPAAQVATAPAHLRNLFGATVSPTVDDCDGNMFDPRFCASSMPSISEAPTMEGYDLPTNDYVAQGTGSPSKTTLNSGPSAPDGDSSTLNSGPSAPDGDSGTLNSGPSAPDGDSSTYNSGPSAPDGDSGTLNSGPSAPDGDSSTYASGPSAPDGDSSFTFNSGPSAPDGDSSFTFNSGPSAPDGDSSNYGDPSSSPTMVSTQCEGRDRTVHMHLYNGKIVPDPMPMELADRSDKLAILELHQTWADEVDAIHAMFMQNGTTICPTDVKVEATATSKTPLTYVVDCTETFWADMYLFVTKDGFSTNPEDKPVDLPPVCQRDGIPTASRHTLSYKVTVSCLCDPSVESSAPSFAPSFSPSVAPSVAPSAAPSSAPSSAPSAEMEQRRIEALTEEGQFHCSSKAYPCEEGPNYVNICHYSTRIGYRTYCVPEGDSEIVRFYKTDYCGPCTGGYAVDETGSV